MSSDDESEEEEESRNAGGKSQEKSTIANVGFNWDVLKNPDLLSNAVGKADESSDDEEVRLACNVCGVVTMEIKKDF